MVWSSWSRFGWLLAAAAMLAAMAMPAASRQPRAYGKYLVAQYQLPATTIARYAALAAGTADNELDSGSSMFADRSPWIGPAQRAGVGHNPYTLVLTVSGVAKAAGDVYAQWQAGWEVHESPAASREIVMAVPGAVREGAVTGERVNLTVNSARVSFRGERRVAPMLGLVQTRNLDIDEVFLQVWSGNPPVASPAMLFSPNALMVALAIGLLFWWMLSRRQVAATSVVAETAQAPDPASENPKILEPVEVDQAMLARLAPRSPDPGHKAQVIDTLHHLLTVGLAIQPVSDDARMQKRRAARKRSAAAP
jgi:hypothetical protein